MTFERPENDATIDEAFIERAIDAANLNALRIALFHQTGDVRLAAMEVKQVPAQGGALTAYVLHRQHHDELREIASEYFSQRLVDPEAAPARPHPTVQQTAELITLFTGEAPTDAELAFSFEDLAFEDFPRAVDWTKGRPENALADFDVTIVGAGFSGLVMAIQLDRLGIRYRIIERNPAAGGTWYTNDYPEARVDIPSAIYQFRFIKQYPWKSYFASQPELADYVAMIIAEYELGPKISLNTSVDDATWNEQTKRWDLRLVGPDGAAESVETNVVISCAGLFNKPNLPDIDGIESFDGHMFHTTEWDHSVDYAGLDVALIGTGSSGAQLMPNLAEAANHLNVYQRTANWVTPVAGYRNQVPTEERWLFDNMPGYWNWFIFASYVAQMQMQTLQVMDPEWIAKGGRVNERNAKFENRLTEFIRSKVGDDDELFAKLVPAYPPLARRLIIDNGWYDALVRDNVDLITDGIERITPTSIVSVDPATGHEVDRPVDMIVLGAGFKVAEYLWPVPYTGRDGTSLEELWAADGARAYLGMTLPKFPNMFMFYGPNSQPRGGGYHSWVEIFSRYVCGLIVEMVESGSSSIEVTQESFDSYNSAMDEEHRTILWEHEGVGGYYVNAFGRSGVNMPWKVHDFYEMVRTADPGNYIHR